MNTLFLTNENSLTFPTGNVDSKKEQISDKCNKVLILGAAGGLSDAFLKMLVMYSKMKTHRLYNFIKDAHFYLVDFNMRIGKDYYAEKAKGLSYTALSLDVVSHRDSLLQLINYEEIEYIIDFCGGTSRPMDVIKSLLECSSKKGLKYINTASAFDDYNEDMMQLNSLRENVSGKFTAIVNTGMNAGVVNWMAERIVKKHGKEGLKACHVFERDTSCIKNPEPNTGYIGWSVVEFVEEAAKCRSTIVIDGKPITLRTNSLSYNFDITIDVEHGSFNGNVVPHDDAYRIGTKYKCDSCFIYRVNDHTEKLLSKYKDVWTAGNYDESLLGDTKFKLLDVNDPAMKDQITGYDLVGVSAQYQGFEVIMYNKLIQEEMIKKYNINATYYQVVSGVLASFNTLIFDKVPGKIYFIDELLETSNVTKYLMEVLPEFKTIIRYKKHNDLDLKSLDGGKLKVDSDDGTIIKESSYKMLNIDGITFF
jgi:hypothetical protein